MSKKILVTGSSGFIGKHLVKELQKKGHHVFFLIRKKPQNSQEIYWNPIEHEIALNQIEGFDAVFHLAGENLSKRRWSKEFKKSIFLSRVRDTKILCKALSCLKKPPSYFFSASAIGFYGNRGDLELNENCCPEKKEESFLSQLCVDWELATESLHQSHTRLVIGRFGIVFSPEGGILTQVLPIFKIGMGGNLGTGKQWMSWISMQDLISAILFTFEKENLSGIFNMTAPCSVRNAEFTSILATYCHKKPFLSLPSWILKLLWGEMAKELLLSSARVIPQKLINSGFIFKNKTLKSYLLGLYYPIL